MIYNKKSPLSFGQNASYCLLLTSPAMGRQRLSACKPATSCQVQIKEFEALKQCLIHLLAWNLCVAATQQALRLSSGCVLHAELTLNNIESAKSNSEELETQQNCDCPGACPDVILKAFSQRKYHLKKNKQNNTKKKSIFFSIILCLVSEACEGKTQFSVWKHYKLALIKNIIWCVCRTLYFKISITSTNQHGFKWFSVIQVDSIFKIILN